MTRFLTLSALCFVAELLAYPVVPVAVAFATADGRLPRWARWWETHDALGWRGPLSEGYPATRWGLVRWLWRNKAYTLRWRYRALPDYASMILHDSGPRTRPFWGVGVYRIVVLDKNNRWWYWRMSLGFGLFSIYINAGWKLAGFLEGARPTETSAVSTGNFIGVGLRTDDWDG